MVFGNIFSRSFLLVLLVCLNTACPGTSNGKNAEGVNSEIAPNGTGKSIESSEESGRVRLNSKEEGSLLHFSVNMITVLVDGESIEYNHDYISDFKKFIGKLNLRIDSIEEIFTSFNKKNKNDLIAFFNDINIINLKLFFLDFRCFLYRRVSSNKSWDKLDKLLENILDKLNDFQKITQQSFPNDTNLESSFKEELKDKNNQFIDCQEENESYGVPSIESSTAEQHFIAHEENLPYYEIEIKDNLSKKNKDLRLDIINWLEKENVDFNKDSYILESDGIAIFLIYIFFSIEYYEKNLENIIKFLNYIKTILNMEDFKRNEFLLFYQYLIERINLNYREKFNLNDNQDWIITILNKEYRYNAATFNELRNPICNTTKTESLKKFFSEKVNENFPMYLFQNDS